MERVKPAGIVDDVSGDAFGTEAVGAILRQDPREYQDRTDAARLQPLAEAQVTVFLTAPCGYRAVEKKRYGALQSSTCCLMSWEGQVQRIINGECVSGK